MGTDQEGKNRGVQSDDGEKRADDHGEKRVVHGDGDGEKRAGHSKPHTLTVYSRTYCHLCDDMIAGLHLLQARFHFDIEVVDVDADAHLETLYGEHVPVLKARERELCRHRLDPVLVTDYLAGIR